jgi:hypothetical protein
LASVAELDHRSAEERVAGSGTETARADDVPKQRHDDGTPRVAAPPPDPAGER